MGQTKKRNVGHGNAQINSIRRPVYLHTFFILRDQCNRNLLIVGGRYWDRTSGPCRVNPTFGETGAIYQLLTLTGSVQLGPKQPESV